MAIDIGTFLTGLYGFYNTLFEPLLALGQYHALIFFSATLAGLFSIIYYILLDVEKNQKLRDKIEKKQEKMREARKNGESDKASNHMQETIKLNQEMMMLNFKPMIATMVFVAFFFPWLGATFSPSIDLAQTGNNTFAGNLTYAGETTPITVENNTEPVLKVDGQQVQLGQSFKAQGIEWEFKKFGDKSGGFISTTSGVRAKVAAVFVQLPISIPLAGSALNWLGFYILIAMPLTFIFRKALGIQ